MWSTKWTGEYPNLCSGEWILYHNGEEKTDINIPFQSRPAYTYGEHEKWYINDFGEETCIVYKDGLSCDNWCSHHAQWLSSFSSPRDWEAIFEAFQINDWRFGECGGCM